MNTARNLAAIDLGAESGRVVLCRWNGHEGTMEEVHRFANGPKPVDNHLVWDVDCLWNEILRGLLKAAAKTRGHIDSLGVDGWGVDYTLVAPDGERLGHAYSYRDKRNQRAMERTFALIPRERIYEITGIQFMPFNTLYQLMAHIAEFPEEWELAEHWLTLPEYFQYRLSGVAAAEYTEASTTQLLDVHTRSWSKDLASTLGLDLRKFAPIVRPGAWMGKLRPDVAEEVGLSNAQVIAPACHDTGSAVAGIPFSHKGMAFISSGTWSLVGTVLHNPVVKTDALERPFTNEGGVAGSIRFLRNVCGLWLFQECLREWNGQGRNLTAAALAEQCMDAPLDGPRFPVDEAAFLAPGYMVERINESLHAAGFAEENRPAELAAIIFRSLALRYAEVVSELSRVSGKALQRLCIVGGGVKNEALNRLTGLATELEVVRGPSESTAAGNLAVQIASLENAVTLEQIQSISGRLKFAAPE